jgi:septal ring factor EnvC (AmiA/AmiB activator)
MTDFVHEAPKDPNKASAPKEEKPTTERERMKKVYTYVAILFTVAFLLILWTFLMNQRSINEIKSGNSALQSTLEENDTLEARVKELETQLAEAEEDKDSLSETVERKSEQLRALDWLIEIENNYSAKDYDAARDNIRAFEKEGAAESLPEQPLRTAITGDDALSPAARYHALVAELFPNGIN